MRDLPELDLDLKAPEKFGNVAAKLDDDQRRTLAEDVIELVHVDDTSMNEWLGKARGYLNKVKTDRGNETPQDREEEGSSEQPPPSTEMTLAAVIQFAARATGAILSEPDLAKASEPTGKPLAEWLSKQLRTDDPYWVLDTDPLAVHMAVTGLAWRKCTYDDYDKALRSHFLTCEEVIVNANVRAIERSPRITHKFTRYPYEIERSISRKHWIDYEPDFDDADPQALHNFYETDLWVDLTGAGNAQPWTFTMALDDTAQIVRIAPRWSRKTFVEDDDVMFFRPIHRFYPYRFLPNPDGGFFPIGFGELLSRVESAGDNLLGNIVTTAKSEAANGGVYAGGGTGLPATPIELKANRVVQIPTERPISDAFQAFPQKSVSTGSVAVLEKLMTLGDRLSGTLNMLENAPASMTATLAKGIIDNGSQSQGAVHRRIVSSMTQEFRMRIRMADAYDMIPQDLAPLAGGAGIEVTADPSLATEMQRSALGQVYLEMIQHAPAFDPFEAALRFCQTMRIPNPEKLVGKAQAPQLTPAEKAKAVTELQKAKTQHMGAMGDLAVKITQAIKNLVDANGGTVDTRVALLEAQQLEFMLSQMNSMQDDPNAQSGGMAQQPGDASPAQLPAPPQDGGGQQVPDGGGAPGPDIAGPGGGAA